MSLDILIIIAYLVIINIVGLKFSKSGSIQDYFLGGRTIPWIIACMSIVATETSTLTFISIPGVAYIQGMGFLQVALGYIVGRVLVALILIPRYFDGNFVTVYQFIQDKFGPTSRKLISVIFHITRLFGDSIRLFATAIPLTFLLGWDFRISILVIGIATFSYTFYGGLQSVVIVDSIQLVLYIFCAFVGMYIITEMMNQPISSILSLIPEKSLTVIFSGMDDGFSGIFKSYNIISGIIGGAFLSFASHGTDHLIVQRILSCKDKRAAQKAMIASGVIVFFQFALFLLFGLFIKMLLEGRSFQKSDEVIPFFIINHLPEGFRGLMLAGIFSAAMSTLSSSINSLSSSTAFDLLEIDKRNVTDLQKVKFSKLIAFFWLIIIIIVSILFNYTSKPLVEIALKIASITYGGMIGMFLMGRFFQNFSEVAAIIGLITSLLVNIYILTGTEVFWLWYVTIGFFVSFIVGIIGNKLFNRQ